MTNYLKILIVSSLFLSAVILIGQNLGKPFWGEHDWNGARYGNIAKNYLRYGLLETKFGQVENGGISKPPDFIYYTHYQPLLPLLIAGSYKIFGVSEFATRLVPLIASAGLIIVIYLIIQTLFSKLSGVFAALIALVTPMVRYYGKNPVHEPLAAFFGALTFYGAVLIKKKNKHGWKFLITGLILTALTNWSFVFLIAGISIFLYSKNTIWKLVKLWILGAVLGILQFIHAYILTGSVFGGGLIGALLLRTSLDKTTTSFGFFGYILRIRLWASTLFTNTLLITSVLGLILAAYKKYYEFLRLLAGTLIFSFYSVFFANASFIHSYFIYYFILPLSLMAGYLFFIAFKHDKRLILIFAVILIGAYFERNSYLNALNSSSGDRIAVESAKVVKILTKPADLISVEPADYAESRLPILSYYSERNIITGNSSQWTLKITGSTYELFKN